MYHHALRPIAFPIAKPQCSYPGLMCAAPGTAGLMQLFFTHCGTQLALRPACIHHFHGAGPIAQVVQVPCFFIIPSSSNACAHWRSRISHNACAVKQQRARVCGLSPEPPAGSGGVAIIAGSIPLGRACAAPLKAQACFDVRVGAGIYHVRTQGHARVVWGWGCRVGQGWVGRDKAGRGCSPHDSRGWRRGGHCPGLALACMAGAQPQARGGG